MSLFNRLFKKTTPSPSQPPVIPRPLAPNAPPRQNLHRVTFETLDGVGYEAEGVYRTDYAVFDSRETGQPAPASGSVGIIHFDFVHSFPHVSWASETGRDAEYPTGFSYKLLSARHEPGGNLECVVVRLLADGSKTILKRFMVPQDQFGLMEAELIPTYESVFSVKFTRMDFSQARTPEEMVKLITGGQAPHGKPPFMLELTVSRPEKAAGPPPIQTTQAPPVIQQKQSQVYIGDYAEFPPTEKPPLPHGTVGMLHIDFKHVFPHLAWTSDTIFRKENPSGFGLKILTARNEPSGQLECVFLQQMIDGGKFVIRRFSTTPVDFHLIVEMVNDLESSQSTKFTCEDYRGIRTAVEFKKRITGAAPPHN